MRGGVDCLIPDVVLVGRGRADLLPAVDRLLGYLGARALLLPAIESVDGVVTSRPSRLPPRCPIFISRWEDSGCRILVPAGQAKKP
jgi:hypothetical protein